MRLVHVLALALLAALFGCNSSPKEKTQPVATPVEECSLALLDRIEPSIGAVLSRKPILASAAPQATPAGTIEMQPRTVQFPCVPGESSKTCLQRAHDSIPADSRSGMRASHPTGSREVTIDYVARVRIPGPDAAPALVSAGVRVTWFPPKGADPEPARAAAVKELEGLGLVVVSSREGASSYHLDLRCRNGATTVAERRDTPRPALSAVVIGSLPPPVTPADSVLRLIPPRSVVIADGILQPKERLELDYDAMAKIDRDFFKLNIGFLVQPPPPNAKTDCVRISSKTGSAMSCVGGQIPFTGAPSYYENMEDVPIPVVVYAVPR